MTNDIGNPSDGKMQKENQEERKPSFTEMQFRRSPEDNAGSDSDSSPKSSTFGQGPAGREHLLKKSKKILSFVEQEVKESDRVRRTSDIGSARGYHFWRY